MRAAVLLKYVLDPEILSRDFDLDLATGLPTTSFPSFQFDQYDRIALEIALKWRDSAGATVSAVCTGPDAAQDRLRETLALKADDAMLMESARPLNDYDRASAFSNWAKTQDVALVLCGRMSSDTDSSEAGPLVAELLGWPLITGVVRLESREDRIACKREAGDGYEWITLEAPFVVTVTNASDNAPRKAKLQDVMRAQRRPIARVAAADYLDGNLGRGLETVRAHIPSMTRICHIIEGRDARDKAAELSRRLIPLLSRKPSVRAMAEAP